MARTPDLTMVGPRQISVDPGSSRATRAFQVDTYDLLAPVKVSWAGAVIASPSNGRYTSVTFDYSELVREAASRASSVPLPPTPTGSPRRRPSCRDLHDEDRREYPSRVHDETVAPQCR
jgi:hypothetical protein